MIKQTLQIDDFRVRLNGQHQAAIPEMLSSSLFHGPLHTHQCTSSQRFHPLTKLSPYLEALNLEMLPPPLTNKQRLTISINGQLFTEPSGDGELEE